MEMLIWYMRLHYYCIEASDSESPLEEIHLLPPAIRVFYASGKQA